MIEYIAIGISAAFAVGFILGTGKRKDLYQLVFDIQSKSDKYSDEIRAIERILQLHRNNNDTNKNDTNKP